MGSSREKSIIAILKGNKNLFRILMVTIIFSPTLYKVQEGIEECTKKVNDWYGPKIYFTLLSLFYVSKGVNGNLFAIASKSKKK